MYTTQDPPETKAEKKYRTTFYLTEENKVLLDRVPRGKKTSLINQALSELLKGMEKEKNKQKLFNMIKEIEPVAYEQSSVEMVRTLRNEHDNKPEDL